MKIPIIELFKLALDMLIWHFFFSEIISSTWRQDPNGKHIAKWPRFQIQAILQEVWHP